MGTIRRGVHRPLEDEANRIIKQSLAGVTKHSEKSDILTPWKEQARIRREVYVVTGTPDRSTRLGMFHRAVNPSKPELNSRMGVARPRDFAKGLSDFVAGDQIHSDEGWG